MVIAHNLALFALACDLFLGIIVLTTNPRRPTNRSFLILTVVLGAWLTGINYAFTSRTTGEAAFYIKFCSFFGALVPLSFALLRISVIHYRDSISAHFWRMRYWLLAGGLVAVFSLTPGFLAAVYLPSPKPGADLPSVPEAVYGPLAPIYHLYLQASLFVVLVLLIRDQFGDRTGGIHRKELQFVLLGFLTMAASIFAIPLVQTLTHNSQVIRFAPLRVIVFTLIIAYGITSRGILHVQAIFRLALSYLLLAGFASLIFLTAWTAFTWSAGQLRLSAGTWTSVLAAMVTAVLINASSTPLRIVAKKILPPSDIDFEKTVSQVGQVVQSVTTLEALLDGFSRALSTAVSTPKVRVFVQETNGTCEYSSGKDRMVLASTDVVLQRVQAGATDIALEELHRDAPTAERTALLTRMEILETDLIVPIRYHGEFSGLIVFAIRPGGRIYGGVGRATLQHIAEQLGIAIANSRLYTEARQSQVYIQFLVDHLTCGVIATDTAGKLTVVNPEARRLLTLDEFAQPSELDLPIEITGLISPTLEGDFIGRDEEITLSPGARDQKNLRVSCLPFASEEHEMLGAVLVLNDHTAIERLQTQVRQADRLASIGTLASGMAHEIKNPLTALKTFTQLLPKRYQDAEFRSDFTGIVGSEIQRIERIVNQLLAFARPAPLMIEQINLHDLVDHAVRLVGPQAARQSIQVRTRLRATHDFVAADKDRLQQVLLNLMLNALQACDDGSWLELTTELEEGTAMQEPAIRLDVRDGGRGISAEELPRIFDPFYTTKSEGTGLGLSVSYNIIVEHKGRMEVHSDLGKGTCFSIYLPVC